MPDGTLTAGENRPTSVIRIRRIVLFPDPDAPDQRNHFTRRNRKAKTPESFKITKTIGNAFDTNNGGRHSANTPLSRLLTPEDSVVRSKASQLFY